MVSKMIISFVDKKLEQCWLCAQCDEIHHTVRKSVIYKLDLLHFAGTLDELSAIPSVRLHPLHGKETSMYTLDVDIKWALVFQYDADAGGFRGVWLKDMSGNPRSKKR